MAINNCPTCGGDGYLAVTLANSNSCWCDWATPTPAPPRVEAVHWIDEIPPGRITDVVKKFLATDDELSSDELNLLKWYIGQWCDKLMALAEGRMTAQGFAEHSEFTEGWLSKLAAAGDSNELHDLQDWLLDKGIDPF